MDDFEAILKKKQEIFLDNLADRVFQLSQENIDKNSTDTGKLAGSGDILSRPGTRQIVYRAVTYAEGGRIPLARYVEYGVAPHMPPVKPLEKWGQRKLHKKGMGWPLAMKIKKDGIDEKPFLRPAVDRVRHDLLMGHAKKYLPSGGRV